MKKLTLLATSVALATAVSVPAQAEVSANVGFVSDYYFRGANLGDGGAYAGVDFEAGGFFAGTWWIDDSSAGNDGMENDWYLGYGMEHGAFSWSVGYTRYEYSYTNDYEHEFVVGLAVGPVSAEIVSGSDEDKADGSEVSTDYMVYSLSYEQGPFGVTAGYYEADTTPTYDYTWVEFSVSGTIAEGIDASFNIGAKASDDEGTNDGYAYLDFSKSFDL